MSELSSVFFLLRVDVFSSQDLCCFRGLLSGNEIRALISPRSNLSAESPPGCPPPLIFPRLFLSLDQAWLLVSGVQGHEPCGSYITRTRPYSRRARAPSSEPQPTTLSLLGVDFCRARTQHFEPWTLASWIWPTDVRRTKRATSRRHR